MSANFKRLHCRTAHEIVDGLGSFVSTAEHPAKCLGARVPEEDLHVGLVELEAKRTEDFQSRIVQAKRWFGNVRIECEPVGGPPIRMKGLEVSASVEGESEPLEFLPEKKTTRQVLDRIVDSVGAEPIVGRNGRRREEIRVE